MPTKIGSSAPSLTCTRGEQHLFLAFRTLAQILRGTANLIAAFYLDTCLVERIAGLGGKFRSLPHSSTAPVLRITLVLPTSSLALATAFGMLELAFNDRLCAAAGLSDPSS